MSRNNRERDERRAADALARRREHREAVALDADAAARLADARAALGLDAQRLSAASEPSGGIGVPEAGERRSAPPPRLNRDRSQPNDPERSP